MGMDGVSTIAVVAGRRGNSIERLDELGWSLVYRVAFAYIQYECLNRAAGTTPPVTGR